MDVESSSPQAITKLSSHTAESRSSGTKGDDAAAVAAVAAVAAAAAAPSAAGSDGEMAKSAPSKRKKGTATAVKGKKPKGGGVAKKSKGASNKKAKNDSGHALPSSSPRDSDDEDDDDDDEEEASDGDEESDHGPYCICRGPDDHRWMISCDGCEDWFHGECVKISKEVGENLIQSYICPNCTDGKDYVTRYKKTCSLKGCLKPARIYGLNAAAVRGDSSGGNNNNNNSSLFCSREHRDQWWDRQVASLPKLSKRDNEYRLTQEEFTGLLASSSRSDVSWKLGDEPFHVPADFWDTVDQDQVLTAEERHILSASSADRLKLGEETVLCKKMLELLDMANDRHRAAVAAGHLEKNACGYDSRLDAVNAMAQFEAFVKSPEGEAVFKAGRLEAPPPPSGGGSGGGGADGAAAPGDDGSGSSKDKDKDRNPATDGMCRRRKCNGHAGWFHTHARQAKAQMKELAREAKERLDREERVRNGAAVRYFRKKHERNSVTAAAPLDPRLDCRPSLKGGGFGYE
ncbi:uncharacterized protein E0L32_005640 [Thyridium curvatum]|uniref:PHD-type domain-containing protein n=1 Tax=Thyridium curvatum TaxID=1093900 RepID=A0A507BBG1_9PEZI|nr:uncharacterized protein E0L32_005640 [Thyridium curvatum]TPX13940.1 hypothetical protein E0L32_005640 [Thyridium curvatum]